MNRKNPAAAVVLAALLIPLLLAACDDFERNAYKTLRLARVEYELLQDHAARATVAGDMTTEQWERFAEAGRRFIAAHTLAADALAAYSDVRSAHAPDRRRRLRLQIETTLARLPSLLVDIERLVAPADSDTPTEETPDEET